MQSYFISPNQKRQWLVIWRALAAHRLGVTPQAVTLPQLRQAVRGWSYEGSISNIHYFKKSGPVSRRAPFTPSARVHTFKSLA